MNSAQKTLAFFTFILTFGLHSFAQNSTPTKEIIKYKPSIQMKESIKQFESEKVANGNNGVDDKSNSKTEQKKVLVVPYVVDSTNNPSIPKVRMSENLFDETTGVKEIPIK